MVFNIGNTHKPPAKLDRPADFSSQAQAKRQKTLALCNAAVGLNSLPGSKGEDRIQLLESKIHHGDPLPSSVQEIGLAMAEGRVDFQEGALRMIQEAYGNFSRRQFSVTMGLVTPIRQERQKLQRIQASLEPAHESLNQFWETLSKPQQDQASEKLDKLHQALQKFSVPQLNTLLVNAVKKEHLENIPALVKSGADVNLTNKSGWDLTSLADRDGKAEIVKLLERAGGKIDFYPKAMIDFARDMKNAAEDGHARSEALKALLIKSSQTASFSKALKRKFSETVS